MPCGLHEEHPREGTGDLENQGSVSVSVLHAMRGIGAYWQQTDQYEAEDSTVLWSQRARTHPSSGAAAAEMKLSHRIRVMSSDIICSTTGGIAYLNTHGPPWQRCRHWHRKSSI